MLIRPPDYAYTTYADCLSNTAVEGMALEKNGNFGTLASGEPVAVPAPAQTMMRDLHNHGSRMLAYAAEKYNISRNLKDYIFVPVSVFFNDLPNRNAVGFPLSQLTEFNPEYGCLGYETWKFKPAFQDHKNDDYTQARGMIFDVALRRNDRYEGEPHQLWHLLGYDRNRVKVLCNDILNRERTGYSMGAWVADYRCSICDASSKGGGCEHVANGQPGSMRVWAMQDGSKKIGYLQSQRPVGFECSTVKSPAFFGGVNPNYLLL